MGILSILGRALHRAKEAIPFTRRNKEDPPDEEKGKIPVFHASPEACIYRVPEAMRRAKPKAYTPQMLRIGPLHHPNKANDDEGKTIQSRFQEMEEQKKAYVLEFDERMKGTKHTSKQLRERIEKEEETIRQSYGEPINYINSKEFIDLILHDSIFIVVLFLRHYEERHDNDPYREQTVYTDLILLENQLPYSHMEKLFEPILKTLYKGNPTFLTLVLTYFGMCKHVIEHTSWFTKHFQNLVHHSHSYESIVKRTTRFKHFTDLHRWVMVERLDSKSQKIHRESKRTIRQLPNATKLHDVGVRFKPHKNVPSLDGIKFKRCCLTLPTFVANDTTELILRNTMALEQHCYPHKTYVCNYAKLMDFLVETAKDVELLVNKEIIEDRIGQKDTVANMVNKLCDGVWEEWSLYYDIAEKLNAHSKNRCRRSYGYLRRNYFPNVWRGTATIAATLLLIMTLVQTVSSVIQVRQGFKK